MDAYLSEYVDQVLDAQEYQNGIFSRSSFSKIVTSFFRREK